MQKAEIPFLSAAALAYASATDLRGYPESGSEPQCHSERSEESLVIVDT